MIEAVFLDAGGVLLVPDAVRIAGVLEPFGARIAPIDADRCHYRGVAAWDGVQPPPVSIWDTYFAAYAAEAGVRADDVPEAVARLGVAFREPGCWSRPLPGAHAALRVLAAAGRPTVVVSNSEGTVEAELRRAGLCQVGTGDGVAVELVLDSSVVGVAKPDPGIFRLALDAVGVAPERAVHVGDSLTADVRGAEAAGIRPLHLDPYGFCPAAAGHEHLRSLADLMVLLGEGR